MIIQHVETRLIEKKGVSSIKFLENNISQILRSYLKLSKNKKLCSAMIGNSLNRDSIYNKKKCVGE